MSVLLVAYDLKALCACQEVCVCCVLRSMWHATGPFFKTAPEGAPKYLFREIAPRTEYGANAAGTALRVPFLICGIFYRRGGLCSALYGTVSSKHSFVNVAQILCLCGRPPDVN